MGQGCSVKHVNQIATGIVSDLKNDKSFVCQYVMFPEGPIFMEIPVISTEKTCDWCGGSKHYCPLFDINDRNTRIWLCANTDCTVYKTKKTIKTCQPTLNIKRSILWPLFCELNTIGDMHYDVRFENIRQSAQKVAYMLKFASSPQGIIFMRGDPGTGKTYAAMAICEYFTRSSSYCIFTTQKQMSYNWLISQGDHSNPYTNSVCSTSLLVIDDFATGEPNAKYLEFLIEVINQRLQWKNRGTIITTNLDIIKFNTFCGQALADRIMTGQVFNFEGLSRRKKTIL